jgi:hypothetical protein
MSDSLDFIGVRTKFLRSAMRFRISGSFSKPVPVSVHVVRFCVSSGLAKDYI